MSRLLTVAIPTYRRAAKLDLQLAWLERNIAGLEAVCEIIVSDNASPDDTPTVCRKWHEMLTRRGVNCRSNRNEQNIGPLPNIAPCIEMATSRFTWVIGDDDEIADGTLAWVVARLQANPELASIVLNFQVVGRAVYKRFFKFPTDQLGDGRMVLSACLRQKYWGLAFMTAQIYRTEYAQAALAAWPEGRTNYDYQIFITAFVGARGQVLVTHDRHVKYVTGDNVYETDKRVALTLYADTLEVFVHLSRVGYSATLCRWLARSHLWRFKHRLIRWALDTNPLFTLATIGRIATYLARLYVTGLGYTQDSYRIYR
jgi:abequosyltransferase